MRKRLLASVLALVTMFMFGCSTQHDEPAPASSSTDAAFSPVFSVTAVLTVGDFIWDDANENGLQDDGEKGMDGVTVNLTTCGTTHDILQSTATASGGYYEFTVAPGSYHIMVVYPSGYTATARNVGADDHIDSDCDSNGETVCFAMDTKSADRWDCGLIPSKKEEPLGCRVTGGGVDIDGNWDGTMQAAKCERDRYTFGGQAGANTALPEQPKGEWTHHQQRGPSGSFVFHAGTASAPEYTEIDRIECSDPGFCDPARHAPAHQIDFWGVGTFKNMKDAPASISSHVVVGESLHWFEVNIDDSGEPGKGKKGWAGCPDEGFGLHGGADLVECDCPDFYRITIYEGDNSGTLPMYTVYGYFTGNLQIHPLTGFDSYGATDQTTDERQASIDR